MTLELTVIGKPIPPRRQCVAVIGARACTVYGEEVARQLAMELAGLGLAVVSGAAYGIDGAAHRGALAAGGRTVAVLACGADVDYPNGNAGLLATLRRERTVVSAYPDGSTVSRERFLERNGLIVALSAALVVVEGGQQSGSHNAVNHALRAGVPVFAVPGPVTSAASAASWLPNRLLVDRQARALTCAQDLADVVSDGMSSSLEGGAGDAGRT